MGATSDLAHGRGRAGQSPQVHRRTPLTIIPETSVAEMLRSADAVVLATVNKHIGTRIVDLRPDLEREDPELVLREPLPVPFTEYEVTLNEALKPYEGSAMGSVIRLASRGGTGQFNGITITEDSRAPELLPGRQYLLILRFSKTINALVCDAFGVFEVTGRTVAGSELLRATPHGKELIGLSPERALRIVRVLLAGPH